MAHDNSRTKKTTGRSGYGDFKCLSNSSEISLHIVGGYGIPAIPTKSAGHSWQSGYGKDAIPSYRLPLIYKAKYELVLNSKILLSNF